MPADCLGTIGVRWMIRDGYPLVQFRFELPTETVEAVMPPDEARHFADTIVEALIEVEAQRP